MKKAVSTGVVSLLIVLTLLTSSAGRATGAVAVIDSGSPRHGVALCNANGIALPFFYYDGTAVVVHENIGEWCRVRIGDDFCHVEGYIKADCLRTPLESGAESAVMVGEVAGAADGGALLYWDIAKVPIAFYRLLNHTRVAIIGMNDEYYHVRFGWQYGALPKANVQRTEERVVPDSFAGIPEIGYVFFDPDPEKEEYVLYEFPDEESSRVEDSWLDLQNRPIGAPILLLADLGEWVQIKLRDNDMLHGFMKASFFNRKVLLDDWIVDDKRVITPGDYVVGRELYPGLYTYTIAPGESGLLTVEGSGMPYDKTLGAAGPASYTLYFPEGTRIRLVGQGTMRAMDPEQPILSGGELSYTEGVFFVRYAFPRLGRGTQLAFYEVSVADGCEKGYVISYNLMGSQFDCVVLEKDGTRGWGSDQLSTSYFIEIHDCSLLVTYLDINFH